jgi:hypothetical protein
MPSFFIALMMEAVCTSESLVNIYQIIQPSSYPLLWEPEFNH